MTAPIVAHSWDPYHGDPNNRFPRLGAPQKRVVAREQWTDFRNTHFAMMNNGIFAWDNTVTPVDAALRKQDRRLPSMNPVERKRWRERHALGLEVLTTKGS